MRDTLDLGWVAVAGLIPMALAWLVAARLWRRRVGDEVGTIAGVGIVFAFSIGFIAREFGHVLAVSRACLARGAACYFEPEPFTRYAIYAGIGMLQVFALFLLGLSAEERWRHRNP